MSMRIAKLKQLSVTLSEREKNIVRGFTVISQQSVYAYKNLDVLILEDLREYPGISGLPLGTIHLDLPPVLEKLRKIGIMSRYWCGTATNQGDYTAVIGDDPSSEKNLHISLECWRTGFSRLYFVVALQAFDVQVLKSLYTMLDLGGGSVSSTDSKKRKIKTVLASAEPCSLTLDDGKRLVFKSLNQKQTILMRRALQEGIAIDGWIDLLDEEIAESFHGRKLCDAARAINKKFREEFQVDEDLFELDSTNKRVRLSQNPTMYRLRVQ